ncbi:MAG: hypothetical protein IJH50_10240 [Kiritimatiellae bacterium]|nr:hypothetical protein [Kiritimatiellia bacterium]
MNRNTVKAMIALASSAILFAGCDIDPMGEKREERKRAAEERSQAERARQELESQRVAMTRYATGKRQMFQSRLSEVQQTEKSLRSDLSTLTTIIDNIMFEKDTEGKDKRYETKVLRILKNAEVNTLASKYLASDFSGIIATYIERVRDARAADARYAAAVQDTEEIYGANIEETKKWSQMTHQQRENEINRLKDEITTLESKRKQVLNEYKTTTRHSILGKERQLLERGERKDVTNNKLLEIDDLLAEKRRQIDDLTDPNMQRQMVDKTAIAVQSRQQRAMDTRRVAMQDIDRRLKPKKTVTDVIAEFEADTIGKLRKTISGKIAALDGEVKSLKEKIALADEIILAIPLYDQGEIKRQRQKLENIAVR